MCICRSHDGTNFDALESVARILKRMRDVGYPVSAPADGKVLIDYIMSRNSISEFRWTTVDEIVSKGGALVLITKDEYEQWFAKLFSHCKGKDMHRMGIPARGSNERC